jgi:hypothetical protein
MPHAWYALLVVAFFRPGGEGDRDPGYLLAAGTDPKEARAYMPREGDIIFFDDHNAIWAVLCAKAGTPPQPHVGIVVKRSDGSLAVLEAGPDDSVWVTLQPVARRLRQFHADFDGTITVRRCKEELSREKSEALTRFAEAQEGKRYAVLRLLLQGTAFRSRGPVREMFLAGTDLDRQSWICSELVAAAGTVAGLFPDTVKSNTAYPLDLIDNKKHDLGRNWYDAETWRPARG